MKEYRSDLVARAVTLLLEGMGADPSLPGLKDTPARVARAWEELISGYRLSAAEVLGVRFPSEGYDEMIVLTGIPFTSTCEHHLLPFYGFAHVGYLPNEKKVAGLSKLARLVEMHARRLQIQERLTVGVLNDLKEHLTPRGAGVVVEATHGCMECRGVRAHGVIARTSALSGSFSEPNVKAEFMSFVRSTK